MDLYRCSKKHHNHEFIDIPPLYKNFKHKCIKKNFELQFFKSLNLFTFSEQVF